MALRPHADLSAADWITSSELPPDRLITMGPAGFEAYARLRFIDDPQYPGQSENDIEVAADLPSEHDRLGVLLHVLGRHTSTPDDCFFCLWDGWGTNVVQVDIAQGFSTGTGPARPGLAPGFAPIGQGAPGVPGVPKVSIPHREYFLFQGSLSDLGDWGGAELWPEQPASDLPPAFVWPADHAWCIANDVDPHYAGIGASSAAIAELLAQPDLDVVSADPDAEQPRYW